MKNKKIAHLAVVVALSFTGTVLAAGEMESKTPPPASPPVAPASAVAAPASEAAPAAPAQQAEVIAKPSAPAKRPQAGKVRPKNLDLRHCLELESNAAIAKCAGE